MNNNSKIKWLNIIFNREFQSYLDFDLLKEISMISKLVREKLKSLIFKNLILDLDIVKFDSNVISIAYNIRKLFSEYDYTILREKNNGSIEDSVNDFRIALNDIKKYTKCFNLNCHRAGYYLYPLINLFDSLTELKIYNCEIPYRAFADIGKTLPNLIRLELQLVELIKSTTDVISEKDVTFPPSLSCMSLISNCIVTLTSISDPYEFLFYTKDYQTSSECFILPKVLIPTLKRLDFISYNDEDRELEGFLEVNPNIESLYIREYNLNLTSSLNSLKSLDIDDNISFDIIDQDYRPNSITSLKFSTCSYSENFIKLSQLYSNLVDLSLIFSETRNFSIIDKYLASDLTKLQHLKTFVIVDEYNDLDDQILDFTKFAQIENLKIEILYGSVLNIKFDKCKSLKQVELTGYNDIFNCEFENTFNQYKNWDFEFYEETVIGYKI